MPKEQDHNDRPHDQPHHHECDLAYCWLAFAAYAMGLACLVLGSEDNFNFGVVGVLAWAISMLIFLNCARKGEDE